ncbi:unnamed protein product [Lupinus luteus]|uniref:Trafficking protein particle complex subunit 2 n=1 Tax=Lupinus luteus TaxID=3873 RepID=A0AAV1XHK3_LUPLU
MIICVAVVGHQSFTEADDALKLHHIVHCSLDVVDERDLDVRDADVRNFFRRFHAAYVDAVSNPFHVPGKKITSKTFVERVSTIVKSFGLSSAG